MSKYYQIPIKIISIITLAAFLATQCGLGYAFESKSPLTSSKLRQMQMRDTTASTTGSAQAGGEDAGRRASVIGENKKQPFILSLRFWFLDKASYLKKWWLKVTFRYPEYLDDWASIYQLYWTVCLASPGEKVWLARALPERESRLFEGLLLNRPIELVGEKKLPGQQWIGIALARIWKDKTKRNFIIRRAKELYSLFRKAAYKNRDFSGGAGEAKICLGWQDGPWRFGRGLRGQKVPHYGDIKGGQAALIKFEDIVRQNVVNNVVLDDGRAARVVEVTYLKVEAGKYEITFSCNRKGLGGDKTFKVTIWSDKRYEIEGAKLKDESNFLKQVLTTPWVNDLLTEDVRRWQDFARQFGVVLKIPQEPAKGDAKGQAQASGAGDSKNMLPQHVAPETVTNTVHVPNIDAGLGQADAKGQTAQQIAQSIISEAAKSSATQEKANRLRRLILAAYMSKMSMHSYWLVLDSNSYDEDNLQYVDPIIRMDKSEYVQFWKDLERNDIVWVLFRALGMMPSFRKGKEKEGFLDIRDELFPVGPAPAQALDQSLRSGPGQADAKGDLKNAQSQPTMLETVTSMVHVPTTTLADAKGAAVGLFSFLKQLPLPIKIAGFLLALAFPATIFISIYTYNTWTSLDVKQFELIGLSAGGAFVWTIFFHEIGHYLFAKLSGIKDATLRAMSKMPIILYVSYDHAKIEKWKIVSEGVGGPIGNFISAIIFTGLKYHMIVAGRFPDVIGHFLQAIILSNTLMFVSNLMFKFSTSPRFGTGKLFSLLGFIRDEYKKYSAAPAVGRGGAEAAREEQAQAQALDQSLALHRMVPGLRSGPGQADAKGRDTAAEECLSVLELDDFERIKPFIHSKNELMTSDGLSYTVYQINIPNTVNVYPGTGLKKGLSILTQEIGGGNFFDLLYRQGRLVAVFPANNADAVNKMKGVKFLDLSYLYIRPSGLNKDGFFPMLHNFLEGWQADQEVISHFNSSQRYSNGPLISIEHDRKKYFFVRINKETGETEVDAFRPQDLLDAAELISKMGIFDDRYHSIFFPIYPTVYSNGGEWRKELPVLFKNDKFDLQNGHSVLVVGPGSGIEAWTVALKTKEIVYTIGVNPFEIASTRMLARIFDFTLESKVANNIISTEDKPVFDMKFDRCVWNMPDYTEGPSLYPQELANGHESPIRSYRVLWDGDYKGNLLRRFATGLPFVLKPEGRVMIWNASIYEDKILGPLTGLGRLDYLGKIKLSEGSAFYFFLLKGHGPAEADAKGQVVNIKCENDPNTDNAFYIRAYIGEDDVGQAVCRIEESGSVVWIDNINVIEQYRRCGIGQKLFEEVLRQARKRQATQIALFNSGDIKALKFYRRMAKRLHLDIQGGSTNTVIVFTLPPIPAMEGLTRLRDRIFAVLKEIDAGKRTEPCVVVIDGHAKVGKTFVTDEIRSVLEQMGYPVLLVRPKLCTDGSVVVMGEGEYEEADAKVIIIEELGAYKSTKVLGIDKVDVFAEFTANRLTRYENLHLAAIRHYQGFEKAFLISMSWSIYVRSLYAEPIGKSMSRYNEIEPPDVYLDNSRKYRLSSEAIRDIFSKDAISDPRLKGKVAIVIDQDEQSYLAMKHDLVVNKGFAWQDVKRLYLYRDEILAIEEGDAERISKTMQHVENIAEGREVVFVINNFRGHRLFFDAISQFNGLILSHDDLELLDKEDFIRKVSVEALAIGSAV